MTVMEGLALSGIAQCSRRRETVDADHALTSAATTEAERSKGGFTICVRVASMRNPFHLMKSLLIFFLLAAFIIIACPAWAQSADRTVETLVCFRHGEKPPGGYGQLDNQGLNRALALPKVLLSKYGKPQFIFAPDPHQKVNDDAGDFYYVRPLATAEPTAIKCGMSVQTPFGYKETRELQDELLQPKYRSALVFVAWEHVNLGIFSRRLMTRLKGDARQIPHWYDDDYDSIYVFRITRSQGREEISFIHAYEGLNGQSAAYP